MQIVQASEFRKFLPKHYKKRKVFVSYVDSVSLFGRMWDGGSKSEFSVGNLSTGTITSRIPDARYGDLTDFNRSMDLSENEFVLQTGFFQGKTATAHLYFPKNSEKTA